MFREFNVKFEDVEMLGGADNLLEGTEITKVIVRGDNNKMSSLDSMLKNCNELDTIDGELDLKGVSDIDNLLEGTELVKLINLKNINNENISANNSFPHTEEINIGGEVYNKKAIQNVIASKDWTFDNINYSGTVGDNIVTKEVNIVDDNEVTIQDTLEQKTKGIEIIGQTYENLVVGSGEATLLDELTIESIDGSPKEFSPHIEQPVCVECIEGETYQNLIEGKGEYKLTDTFSTAWTESNSSIENPPSMIEIPEIWGNTIQDETDLSNIQSVGDLYVDENGEAILDEEGNEQYKLEIDCSNDLICDFTKYEYSLKRLWNGILENHIVKSANVLKNEVQFQMNGNIQGVSILGVKANVLGVYTIRFKYNSSDYSPFIRMNSMKKGVFVEQPKTTIKTDEEGYRYAEFSLSKEFDELRFTLGIESCFDASFTHSFSDVAIYLGTGLKIVPQSNKTTILMPQPLRSVSNGNYKDKLYWDSANNKYFIERFVGKQILNFNNIDINYFDSNFLTNKTKTNLVKINTLIENYPNLLRVDFSDKVTSDCICDKAKGTNDYNLHWNLDELACSYNVMTSSNTSGSLALASFRIPKTYDAKDKAIEYIKSLGDITFYIRISPQIVETKILEKPSLETYSPKTYISANTEIQPSQMNIANKQTTIIPMFLNENKKYTVKFNCTKKGISPIKINLGGAVKEINPIIGENVIEIVTSSAIDKKELVLSGEGNIVEDVYIIADNMSTGELQEDGTYKIDIESYGQTNNIFNPRQKYVDGKFINDNGIEQINTGYGYTVDFIESEPNTRYVGQNTSCIYCYDDNKQFISRIPFWGNGTIVSSATPSNCYYVRFQLEWSKLPNKDLRLHKVAEGNSVIDIDDWKSFTISVTSNNPLAKGDKLYWNKSNKRYEIDRGGDIEVPNVSGDVIDLPRLYQRENTNFTIETGNIKPSKTSINYLDID